MRIDFSYDGAGFFGYGVQKDLRTVQGEILRVFNYLTHSKVDIFVAGRTDAGVHARGQVIHVDLTPEHVARLEDPARLNRALPEDIRIHSIQEAPYGFDARFSALWRRYSYRVCDVSDQMNPLTRHQTLFHYKHLDIDAMNQAAQGLMGLQDFAAYCRPRDASTSMREVEKLEWHREGALCIMTVQADAFCHSMVRSLVGAMIPVGDGRRSVDWPGMILESKDRTLSPEVMPAHPLVLEEVGYPEADQMLARQFITRTKRSPDHG